MTDAMAVRDLLVRHRFRFSSELQLQTGIASVLTEAKELFAREIQVSGGRIDFLLECGVGIEVKVGGSMAQLVRQIHGYLDDERIEELLIVTSRSAHLAVPPLFRGKKVVILWLSEGAL